MYKYDQKTGKISKNEKVLGTGYSGHGEGRNNQKMEGVHNVGPIPRGTYSISASYTHPRLGPLTMNLDPLKGTELFGRSLFRIHGNNKINDASQGCIVLPRNIRAFISSNILKDSGLVVE